MIWEAWLQLAMKAKVQHIWHNVPVVNFLYLLFKAIAFVLILIYRQWKWCNMYILVTRHKEIWTYRIAGIISSLFLTAYLMLISRNLITQTLKIFLWKWLAMNYSIFQKSTSLFTGHKICLWVNYIIFTVIIRLWCLLW